MALQPGSRPVPNSPDYQLIRKLGAGAFGEVWHAHGPGGLDVALKFIPLDAHGRTFELRSLEAVKSIRHPNLVSMVGAWHQDDCLILAMELCDRSLQDRLKEVLSEKLQGIPLQELLDNMNDAANGLDALNARGVQHRDVKPANLLLLDSGVKVADFGLAKALEQTIASNSSSGTIAYMAPECFRGQLTQQSDQYSLAVTYYHLRTGQLLFKGDMARIMYGHLEQEPDLSRLPLAENEVLSRALAKAPGKRWPTCKAFASELVKLHEQAKKEECQRLEADRRRQKQEKMAFLKRVLSSHQEWLRGEKSGKRAELRYWNLSGADLSGVDLRGADLFGIDLYEANLSGAQFSTASWADDDEESNWIRTDLSHAKLCRANLSGADLTGANLCKANFAAANLSKSDLSFANLRNANLAGANLSGVDLEAADLIEANLRNAILFKARLDGTDFTRADLREVAFLEVNLKSAVLHDAKLRFAMLSRADLEGANLSNADLSWADLSGAYLAGANLSKANLSCADLSYVKIFGTDLGDADLTGAVLTGTDLDGFDDNETDES